MGVIFGFQISVSRFQNSWLEFCKVLFDAVQMCNTPPDYRMSDGVRVLMQIIGLCLAEQLADMGAQCGAMLGKTELLADVATIVEVALHLYVFANLLAFQS